MASKWIPIDLFWDPSWHWWWRQDVRMIIANIVAESMVTAEESDRIYYLYFKVMEEIDEEIRQCGLHPVHPGWRNWFWLLNVKKSCPITECVPFLQDESLRFPDPVWPKPRWIYSASQPCHTAFTCWARCSQNHSSGCWHQSAEGKLFIQLIIRSSLPPFLLCLHFSCTPLNMFQAFLWVTESAPHCIYHEDSKQVSAWLKVFESVVRVVGSWTWGIFVVPCNLSWPL